LVSVPKLKTFGGKIKKIAIGSTLITSNSTASTNYRHSPVHKNRQFQFFKNPARHSLEHEPGFQIKKSLSISIIPSGRKCNQKFGAGEKKSDLKNDL